MSKAYARVDLKAVAQAWNIFSPRLARLRLRGTWGTRPNALFAAMADSFGTPNAAQSYRTPVLPVFPPARIF